jgi:HlyD family secretion protein
MTDRLLLACAGVPMLCGIALVGLLQRSPAAPARATHAPRPLEAGDLRLAEGGEMPWIGVVVAGSTAELAAEADGRVAAVFVQSGARVAAGDKLVQLDEAESSSEVGIASAELGQRRSELARAAARSDAARTKLERLREGAAWLSKQELEAAIAEARIADAELRAARAGVGMGRAHVSQQRLRRERRLLTAPFAGTVVSLEADPGDSVVAGQIVLRVLSDDRQVRFAFPPGELSERQVAITLQGTPLAVLADIATLRPEIDPSAQLVFATAALPPRLPDAERWIPGAPVLVTRGTTPRSEGR